MDVSGFHLTYCSNIHPGESWTEVREALTSAMPRVRDLLGVSGPMGIGLRLSAAAAATLDSPGPLEEFREFLSGGNYYVFTINGFPFGAFHGERVKERVYLPDWREEARVEYSNRLARLLVELAGDRSDAELSVSTVPGAFRSAAASSDDADAIGANLVRHAAALRALREKTGRTVVLAIEPEPACLIETVDEAVEFFRGRLLRDEFVASCAQGTGSPVAVDDVRRHIGVCLDTCHMAVEFEDPAAAFERLASEGIRVGKVQITSAIETDTRSGREALRRFANDTYLHQVVARRPDRLERHTDLPDALALHDTSADAWRVHFHVPLFLAELGELRTTQRYVASVLDLLKRNRACSSLEVETYTWDVLPAEYRKDDTCSAIARELEWVRRQLAA